MSEQPTGQPNQENNGSEEGESYDIWPRLFWRAIEIVRGVGTGPHDRAIAWATIVMAASTVVMVFVMKGQSKIANETIAIAQDNFRSQERPWLAKQEIVGGIVFGEGDSPRLLVENGGRSPAVGITNCLRVDLRGRGRYPKQFWGGTVEADCSEKRGVPTFIVPGATKSFPSSVDISYMGWDRSESNACLYGVIYYSDTFKPPGRHRVVTCDCQTPQFREWVECPEGNFTDDADERGNFPERP